MHEFLIYLGVVVVFCFIAFLIDILIALFKIIRKKDVRYTSQYYSIEMEPNTNVNADYSVNYLHKGKKRNVKAYVDQKRKLLVLRFERKKDVNLLTDEFDFYVDHNKTPLKIVAKKSYCELEENELNGIIKYARCYKSGISLRITFFIADNI